MLQRAIPIEMYASIEVPPPLHVIVQRLTTKFLSVYTSMNGIPLYTHSNPSLFSTCQSHTFSTPSRGEAADEGSAIKTNRSRVSTASRRRPSSDVPRRAARPPRQPACGQPRGTEPGLHPARPS